MLIKFECLLTSPSLKTSLLPLYKCQQTSGICLYATYYMMSRDISENVRLQNVGAKIMRSHIEATF